LQNAIDALRFALIRANYNPWNILNMQSLQQVVEKHTAGMMHAFQIAQ
jgi:hypothetical protein